MKQLYILTAILLTYVSSIFGQSEITCDNFQIEIRNPRDGNCEAAAGIVDVVIMGGSSDFFIEWTGETSGDIQISGRWFTIRRLPIGEYEVKVTDRNDCERTATFSVDSSTPCDAEEEEINCDELSIQVTSEKAICGNDGKIDIAVENGKPPYVYIWNDEWTGGNRQSFITHQSSFQIDSLWADIYYLTVVDDNACYKTDVEWVTLDSEDFSIEHTIEKRPSCDGLADGELRLEIMQSVEDSVFIKWEGSSSGQQVADSSVVHLSNLAAGDYTVTVTTQSGCQRRFDVSLHPFSFEAKIWQRTNCEQQLGTILINLINFSNASSDYTLKWFGPVSGEMSALTNTYGSTLLDSLPFGQYTLQVVNDNNCMVEQLFDFADYERCGTCADFRVWASSDILTSHFTFDGGVSPYEISYTAPNVDSDTIIIDGCEFDLIYPEAGSYQVKVVDANACEWERTITIRDQPEQSCLNFYVPIEEIECNDGKGNIPLIIRGGSGYYRIVLEGRADYTIRDSVFIYEDVQFANSRSYLTIVHDLITGCRQSFDIPIVECDCATSTVSVAETLPSENRDGQMKLLLEGTPFDSIHLSLYPSFRAPSPQAIRLDEMGRASVTFDSLYSLTYALQMVDADGCHTIRYIDISQKCASEERVISPTIANQSTPFQKKGSRVSISPNPTRGMVKVHIDQLEVDSFQIYIYNLNGALVKQSKGYNGMEQNVGDLANGLYLVQIKTLQAIYTTRLIIAR